MDEFDRAWAAGVYGPEERLELIEGEVIEKVSPQESPHATAISLCAEEMRAAFGRGYHVRVQLPLLLGIRTKPEPDVAVVAGSIRSYAKAHPTQAALVIEVSDSTLEYDRTRKAGLYAAAGIQDYWILNLTDRVLEVYRQPVQSGEKRTDRGSVRWYVHASRLTNAESIAPLSCPNAIIAVADLLP